MSKVENGCCIIDAMSGIDTASPQINCFTDNFNSIKFLMSGIFSDYTIMIITDINGHVEIVNTDGNMLTKSTNSSTNTTTLTWKPGKEITSASGVVVYQIAAYKPNGDSIESVWYSKEGRLVVSESIDTTSHSAEVLGTGPNLLTRLLLEMAQVKESVENLDLTKVDKVDGKELSDENYSLEEKEKLSGIETGAEVNIQSDWEEIDETSDSYIKNKPIIDINYDSESENAQSGKAVAQAIAKLVNGSPEALDTLHELANALGNDENFSATVMEKIGKKADAASLEEVKSDIARILDGRTTVSKASSDSLGNNIVLHYATKEEVTTQIGDIETALDGIITIQNGILGVGVNE